METKAETWETLSHITQESDLRQVRQVHHDTSAEGNVRGLTTMP